MNERIRELALQAREFATTRHPVSNIVLSVNSEKFEEKFAELIVQKCADIGQLYADGNYEVYNQILEYFGVEL